MFKKLFQSLFSKPPPIRTQLQTSAAAGKGPLPTQSSPVEVQPQADQVYQVYEVLPKTNAVADALTPATPVTLWRAQQPKKAAIYYARAETQATPAQMLEAALAVYWLEYFLIKGYNHKQVHGWLMNLKRDSDNFYGGGAMRDEMETPNSMSTSILGLVRATLHYALAHQEALEAELNACEFEAFLSAPLTSVPSNHEDRLTQVNNFKRVEEAGKLPHPLIEHFQMARQNLEFLRKMLNNPAKIQSGPAVIERRILIHQIRQDRNLTAQLDRNNIFIVGEVFRIIIVGQLKPEYSLEIKSGLCMMDMSEGIPAFYWDELLLRNPQAIEQLFHGLDHLSLATGIKFSKPTKDAPREMQRSMLLTELTKVSQYFLWGTLNFHDASLVSVMYRDGLEQGWPHSPVQNRRIREEAPIIAAAIHDGSFDPEFAQHVFKSSRPDG